MCVADEESPPVSFWTMSVSPFSRPYCTWILDLLLLSEGECKILEIGECGMYDLTLL